MTTILALSPRSVRRAKPGRKVFGTTTGYVVLNPTRFGRTSIGTILRVRRDGCAEIRLPDWPDAEMRGEIARIVEKGD